MTPYLLHKTWIDLDHVLAVDSECTVREKMWPGDSRSYALAQMQMMFRSETLEVYLGDISLNQEAKLDPPTAQPMLDAFIAAWKERGQVIPKERNESRR